MSRESFASLASVARLVTRDGAIVDTENDHVEETENVTVVTGATAVFAPTAAAAAAMPTEDDLETVIVAHQAQEDAATASHDPAPAATIPSSSLPSLLDKFSSMLIAAVERKIDLMLASKTIN